MGEGAMTLLLEAAAQRILKIECMDIALDRSGKPPLRISRARHYNHRQSEHAAAREETAEGQISFRFDVSSEQYEPFTKSRLGHPRPPSMPPKDEDYYKMTATFAFGQIWRGSLLYPEVKSTTRKGFYNGPGSAEGKVPQLTCEEPTDADLPSYAELTIPKEFIVPRIQRGKELSEPNYCYFDFEKEKVEIFVKDGYTEISLPR